MKKKIILLAISTLLLTCCGKSNFQETNISEIREETESIAETENEYLEEAEYDDFLKNPNDYIDKKIRMTFRVECILERNEDGYIPVLGYDENDNFIAILEDTDVDYAPDYILKIKGTILGEGTLTYEDGTEKHMPKIVAEKIRVSDIVDSDSVAIIYNPDTREARWAPHTQKEDDLMIVYDMDHEEIGSVYVRKKDIIGEIPDVSSEMSGAFGDGYEFCYYVAYKDNIEYFYTFHLDTMSWECLGTVEEVNRNHGDNW